MRKFRLGIWTLGLALLLTSACVGPRNGPPPRDDRDKPPQTLEECMTLLTGRLHLGPEQVEQVRPVVHDFLSKRDDIMQREPVGGSREDHKAVAEELRRLRAGLEENMRPLLTPAQMDIFLDMAEELFTPLKGGPPPQGPGGLPGHMPGRMPDGMPGGFRAY